MLFQAASAIQEAVIREWQLLSAEDVCSLRDYLLDYALRHTRSVARSRAQGGSAGRAAATSAASCPQWVSPLPRHPHAPAPSPRLDPPACRILCSSRCCAPLPPCTRWPGLDRYTASHAMSSVLVQHAPATLTAPVCRHKQLTGPAGHDSFFERLLQLFSADASEAVRVWVAGGGVGCHARNIFSCPARCPPAHSLPPRAAGVHRRHFRQCHP